MATMSRSNRVTIPNAVVHPTEKHLYVDGPSELCQRDSADPRSQVLFIGQRVDSHCAWKSVVVVSFLPNDIKAVRVLHVPVDERTGCDLRQRIAGSK